MEIAKLLVCLITATASIAAYCQNAPANPDTGPQVSAAARKIQDSAIVIDTHADTPDRSSHR